MGNALTTKEQSLALQKLSPETEAIITDWVGTCWFSYPNWGAGLDVLDAKMKFFKVKLARFTYEEISRAFDQYTDGNGGGSRPFDFPIPAQIIKLIEGYRADEETKKMIQYCKEMDKEKEQKNG